jgi:hypothetical protein
MAHMAPHAHKLAYNMYLFQIKCQKAALVDLNSFKRIYNRIVSAFYGNNRKIGLLETREEIIFGPWT